MRTFIFTLLLSQQREKVALVLSVPLVLFNIILKFMYIIL